MKRVLFVYLVVCFVATGIAGADPLNRPGMIDNARVTVAGQEYVCVLFPSLNDPTHWFCAMKNPCIAETLVDGRLEPELTFFRFQQADPRDPNKLVEAGIIHCSFTISPPREALDRLTSMIPRPGGRPIRLESLPLSGLGLKISTREGKKVIGTASPTRGIDSDNLLRTAAFTVPLPTIDSGFLHLLTDDSTGVKFELTYNLALSDQAPTGSQDRLDPGKPPVQSGNPPKQISLPTAISLPRPGSGVTPLPGRLDPLGAGARPSGASSRLSQPTSSSRSSASARDFARNLGRGSGSSLSSSRTAGGKALDALDREAARQSGWVWAAYGFLGLAKYPQDIRAKHVQTLDDRDGWKFSYLFLPNIGKISSGLYSEVTLEAVMVSQGHEFVKRSIRWTPDSLWRDEENKRVTFLKVSLADILAGPESMLASAVFILTTNIKGKSEEVFTAVASVPVVAGNIPVAVPAELAEVLTLRFSLLDWEAPSTVPDRLTQVELRLQDGDRTLVRVLKPSRSPDGSMDLPTAFQWLVPIGHLQKPGVVRANVFFCTADGKRIPWRLNNKPLEQDFSGGLYVFDENDWGNT